MNGRIIKLNSLTDSYRARAEDDYFFLIRNNRLVFFFISRIKIRDIALKFGSASVYHFIHGHNFILDPDFENLFFALFPKIRYRSIAKSHFLGGEQDIQISL